MRITSVKEQLKLSVSMHGFRTVAAFALCASYPGLASAQDRDGADIIYSGGSIITMDDEQPVVEALAIDDGKIVAVGSESEVMRWRKSGTQLVDLQDKALLPGFVDPHAHVVGGGVQALGANLLAPPDGTVRNIPELIEQVKQWMVDNPSIPERYNVIVGFGYDNASLAEQRHPTVDELDQISSTVPIYLVHQSGHFGATNTAGLAKMGIKDDTPNPSGGIIRRDANGKANGVLEEYAHFENMGKLFDTLDAQAAAGILEAGLKMWASYGYTTAQEGRGVPPVIRLLRAAADAGKLPIDVAAYVDVLVDRDLILREHSKDYRGNFRIAGAKLTLDGSAQGFTAWRDRPYFDPVGDYPPAYSGYPAVEAERVADAVEWTYANDIQLLTHANAEAASDLIIASARRAEAKHGQDDRRNVLIHAQFMRPDQMDSINDLGIIPSFFSMHTFYWADWHREHTVGPVAADNMSPTGWALERNMKFTIHTDAPVAFPDTMRALDATVTRRSRTNDIMGAEHRVDVMTALKAMTIWPAYQYFEEDEKGSLEVGKLADLVILSASPLEVDPDTIDQIKVMETIKDGKTVFRREP